MSKKRIFLFTIFVFSCFLYGEVFIFYPGGEDKSEPFNNIFIFSSSSVCSLVVKDITDFNVIGYDILINTKTFLKVDVSNRNYIVIDTFFYLTTKRSFAWYLESYENGVLKKSNILFFNTGDDYITNFTNHNRDDYLSIILKIFGIAGFYPTGRVWINDVQVNIKDLDLSNVKNIRWKTKR